VTLPSEATSLLDLLVPRIQKVLGPDLVGVYIRGSVALGDFIPETSDLDLLVVTQRSVDRDSFAALQDLHDQLAAGPHPFGRRLEAAYIDRDAVRRFVPGRQHPTLGQGERLTWTEHHDNWILERWTVREHGITVIGPNPRTLIEPVGRHEIVPAVSRRLHDWVDWANQPDDPEWQEPRSHKAYVVETMCRALYTLTHGELASKARSVVWAREALPMPWRDLAARSQGWRTDRTIDQSLVPEVMAFIHWTGDCAARGVTYPQE
jgi:hypothetical protein